MKTNKYRESATWIQFNRSHLLKLKFLVAFVSAYAAIMIVLIVANRMDWLPIPHLVLAIVNLVIGIFGQIVGLFLVIMLFDTAYRRWHSELGKLFGSTGKTSRLGPFGFYRFVCYPKPAEVLAEILDQKLEIGSLHEKKEELTQQQQQWENQLKTEEARQRLTTLDGKFRPGSREAKLLNRALRKGTNATAMEQLFAELDSAPGQAEQVVSTPAAKDKIAELESTYALELESGSDTDAEKLFAASQLQQDRKQRRNTLIEAIRLLKAANKKRREQEEKLRAYKRSAATG